METEEERRYVNQRPERIELKMDRLVEAVTTVARLEERIGQSLDQHHRIETEMETLRQRINAAEMQLQESRAYSGLLVSGLQQLMAIAGAALAGGTWAYFKLAGGS